MNWYDDGGGCFDTGNHCFWLKEVPVSCPTAGYPPQVWSCYEYQLLECQTQNCTDADGDGHYVYDAQLCPQGDDCDDMDSERHPGLEEQCHDSGRKDEDCDDRANCEDDYCWAGQVPECEEQCDHDHDDHYKLTCGGDDCDDDCDLCFPGYGQPPFGLNGEASGSNSCDDQKDNDCDGNDKIDCNDSDCSEMEICIPPSPTPTPPPLPDGCEPPYGSEGSFCSFGTYYDPNSGLCCPGGGNSGGCDTTWLAPQCAYNVSEYCACREYAGIWQEEFCRCWAESPIVIDVEGNGFDLTDAANGVNFDMRADGTPDHLGWIAQDSDDVFLVFDRNGNGNIDNGRELFGNITPQPSDPNRNGFLALAEYDKSEYGGNEDGRITAQDAIFGSLRLWRDSSHNGISESNELFSLPDLGLRRVDLDYKVSQRVDSHGNSFRYRAKVRDAHGAQLGRWAWDVFLVNGGPSSSSIFAQQPAFSFGATTCVR